MPLLNNYQPPPALSIESYHLNTPKEEYDLNFVFDVPEVMETSASTVKNGIESRGSEPDDSESGGQAREAEKATNESEFVSKGVRLVPLIPSVHARQVFQLLMTHQQALFRYLPYAFTTFEEYLTFLELRRREEGTLLFCVYDQSLQMLPPPPTNENGVDCEATITPVVLEEERPERLAGVVGLLKCNRENRWGEVGHLAILPPFHRSHVTTHACSLLIQYLFDTCSLRRVCWFAHADNAPSIKAGERLGLKREALLKWERVLGPGKEGKALDGPGLDEDVKEKEEMEGRGQGRDSVVLGLGWDEWRTAGRAKLVELLERLVKKRTWQDLETVND